MPFGWQNGWPMKHPVLPAPASCETRAARIGERTE